MKTQEQQKFDTLLKRVIELKNNLFGFGNWNKSFLPTTIDGCLSYIKYCKTEYNVIG
jgi:hypothetical protein